MLQIDFRQKIRLWIPRVIFVLPFVVYCLFVIRDMSNVPESDDFVTILSFLIGFTRLNTVQEKAILLFAQHNEHRIAFTHAIALLYYYLFHQIDFRSLIVFGNIGWFLAIALLVWYSQKTLRVSLAYLLPIPYLALSFVLGENMFFASAAIGFYWSTVFSLAFLFFLIKEKVFLYCASFVAALFTTGGGLVLVPIGMLYLFLQKKWKALVSLP